MEMGSVTKPATAPAAPTRADQVTASATVRTDLAPDAAVQPAEAVRFEPNQGADRRAALDEVVRAAMERHLTIDPRTRDVVIRSVDPDTGTVVEQVPDETLLKLRVYARELRDAHVAESGEGPKRTTRLA